MKTLAGRGARSLAAAGAGGAAVALWWAVLSLWSGPVFALTLNVTLSESCPQERDIGCSLGTALLLFVIGISVITTSAFGLAWWGLSLLGVRPAWHVALLGPVFAFLLLWLTQNVLDVSGAWPMWVLTVAVAYAVAALVTTRGPG